MKKLISFLTLFALLTTFAFSVSAKEISTDEGSYVMEFVASKSEVNVGDTFDVSVYLKDATNSEETLDFVDGFGSFYLNVDFDENYVSFNKTASTLTNYGLKASNCTARESDIAIETATETTANISSTTPVVVLNFTANAAGDASFVIGSQGFNIADQNFSEVNADNTVVKTVTVKVVAGSTDIIVDEENFASATDDSYTSADVTSGDVKVNGTVIATMGEGGKIHTYFNKNTAGKVLEAEKYGIEATINGKTFRFPGKTAVSADKAWAIKLVIPTGKFSDGVAASVTNITAYTID